MNTRQGRPDRSEAPRDPGLQAERTSLAWNRTAVTVVANALLALRAGLAQQRTVVVALGMVLLMCGAALTAFGWIRRRQLLGQDNLASPSSSMIGGATLFALTCCAVAVATVQS
jgi:uncharacterized membrane protein YidH (DUF202 family)